jgi:hypothetical protein
MMGMMITWARAQGKLLTWFLADISLILDFFSYLVYNSVVRILITGTADNGSS